MQPRFGQDKVNNETYQERIQSGGIVGFNPCCRYSRKVLRDSDQKPYDPCDTPGPVNSEPRPRPSPSRANVVSNHRTADRAKGCGHKTEETHQIVRNTCNSQKDAYGESGKSGCGSRDLWQHGAEAVRCDERREAGWHHGSNGKEEEHHWRQSTHTRDCGGVVVALSAGAATQIAGDRKQRQATSDQSAADDATDTAEDDVFPVSVIHSEVGAGGTGGSKVSDYDRE